MLRHWIASHNREVKINWGKGEAAIGNEIVGWTLSTLNFRVDIFGVYIYIPTHYIKLQHTRTNNYSTVPIKSKNIKLTNAN
jgi:hypothetical protein